MSETESDGADALIEARAETGAAESKDGHVQAEKPHRVPDRLVDKAIKYSCYQFVIGSIASSLLGGMFVTGFALKLGATNAQIGLMTAVPMSCVLLQLVASSLVERGISRRLFTTYLAAAWAVVWMLIAALPFVIPKAGASVKITALVGLITLASATAHLSSNPRSSWLADLIPSRRLGEFFGKSMLFSSLVGLIFGIIGGWFLDHVKHRGISAFSWIFFVGAAIGLISAFLNLPQADVPLSKHEHSHNFAKMVKQAFKNRGFVLMIGFAIVWSMQGIAGPFVPVYVLRDLKVPFFGYGVINAFGSISVLLSSTFWGRMIDRYGCRPIMIACVLAIVPIPICWIWINTALRAYFILIPVNLFGGFVTTGVSVAVSKMLYNVTDTEGKSVQLAIYPILAYASSAPMALLGGHLPDWLRAIGIHSDLRCTFYMMPIFTLASAVFLFKIKEQNSSGTSHFVRNLPRHLTPTALKRGGGQAEPIHMRS